MTVVVKHLLCVSELQADRRRGIILPAGFQKNERGARWKDRVVWQSWRWWNQGLLIPLLKLREVKLLGSDKWTKRIKKLSQEQWTNYTRVMEYVPYYSVSKQRNWKWAQPRSRRCCWNTTEKHHLVCCHRITTSPADNSLITNVVHTCSQDKMEISYKTRSKWSLKQVRRGDTVENW